MLTLNWIVPLTFLKYNKKERMDNRIISKRIIIKNIKLEIINKWNVLKNVRYSTKLNLCIPNKRYIKNSIESKRLIL